MATIVLTGGGSAGHCTPHLAVLPYIKNHFDKIYYIGSENGIEREIIEREKIPYYFVPCAKLKRKISADNLTMPFTVIKGIIKAGKILDELKPDVIFSKGGYVSVPTVIAGKKRNIPIVSHESDYTVGLANKITARCCKKVLTSFPETAKTVKNGEFIGAPIRRLSKKIERKDALKIFGFSGKKPILLAVGGSLGATAINDVLRTALDGVLIDFDVIHVCGKGNVLDDLNRSGYFQTEFLSKIETAYAVTDVCVTRAGSNACFELLNLKIPCVFIPLPKGISRGDQVLNASYFEKYGLASVLSQDALTAQSLKNYVDATYANRFNLRKNFDKHPISDKSRQISRILCDYAKN